MKKCYSCKLIQASSLQGYITNDNGGKSLHSSDNKYLYDSNDYISKHDDMFFGEIIVTKTVNPYMVRELITGMPIPVVYSYKKEKEYNMPYIWTRHPFGKVHTYIRLFKKVDSYYPDRLIGLCEIDDSDVILDYLKLHSDKEVYKDELFDFFEKGQEKMSNKMLDNRMLLEESKNKKVKIKKLIKDIRKTSIHKY